MTVESLLDRITTEVDLWEADWEARAMRCTPGEFDALGLPVRAREDWEDWEPRTEEAGPRAVPVAPGRVSLGPFSVAGLQAALLRGGDGADPPHRAARPLSGVPIHYTSGPSEHEWQDVGYTISGVNVRAVQAAVMPSLARERARTEYRRAQAVRDGVRLGLTEEEVREVIDVWTDHYRRLPIPLPWWDVCRAIEDRAAGDPWTPREQFREILQSSFTRVRNTVTVAYSALPRALRDDLALRSPPARPATREAILEWRRHRGRHPFTDEPQRRRRTDHRAGPAPRGDQRRANRQDRRTPR